MILLAALIAGAQADFPVRGGSGRRCEPAHLHALIGRRRGARIEKEALRLSGAAILRWVRPGEMVTMDFRTDRLTVHVDRHGRIVRATCG